MSTVAYTTLANLDRYMAEASMDANHPWRREIAVSLVFVPEKLVDAEAVLAAAGDIDRAAGIIDDLLELAKAQCNSENEIGSAIGAARRYLRDISVATEFLSEVAS